MKRNYVLIALCLLVSVADAHCLAEQNNLAAEIVTKSYATADFKRILAKADDGDRRLNGKSRAYYAAAIGDLDLLVKVTNVGRKPPLDIGEALIAAAQVGQKDTMVYLIERLKVPVDFETHEGLTALIAASDAGEMRTLEELLKRGANPLHRTKSGFTGFHYAIIGRHVATIKRLLAANAKLLDIATPRGKTPLRFAVKMGDPCTIAAVRSGIPHH
jgi:ankyrin repeat protein